ncbi:MAG TPA: FAD-dependent oxidoreductase [Armatimonadota bacterium]|jgi:ferredoxin
MPKLTIDGQEIIVEEGATILAAAQRAGIAIPTLCHLPERPALTSCFVCVVKVNGGARLLPACATRVAEGMVVESDSEEVRTARRTALELLFSDHRGDCLGPCQSACPAHLDIPAMLRHIAAGRVREALITVKAHIALPAVLGRLCPEFCERACRRAHYDGAVTICALKRYVADVDLASSDPYLPACRPASGQRVAIVGAGPAGLAAAYYLLQHGHACTLYDRREQPGGTLHEVVRDGRLPGEVLQAEIARIAQLGATFRQGVGVGDTLSVAGLRADYDAVLLTVGELSADEASCLHVTLAGKGIHVDRHTLQTEHAGIFAAGSAVSPSPHVVRAVAEGRRAAYAIQRFLTGEAHDEPHFSVHMGRMTDAEATTFAEGMSPTPRAVCCQDGLSAETAQQEAARCLHCDCRKVADCRLRDYAIAYDVHAGKYAGEAHRRFERDTSQPAVVYETGKCITCGRCVQIAEEARERLGLAFVGRGFAVRVAVPFSATLADGLTTVAAACVAACPTGALAHRETETAQ